jgi:predicted metal-dependent hydrolase
VAIDRLGEEVVSVPAGGSNEMSREGFRSEIARWAERLDVHPAEVRIRDMRRKWASCSIAGRLTFDSVLLTKPRHFRDEVVVHELLHLKVPNHGRLFKSLLTAYLETDPHP